MQPRNLLTKPQIERLKALGQGLRVEAVMGNRILVKPVVPNTEMDRLEKEGILVMPEDAKEENTPLPSVGVVMQRGTAVSKGSLLQRLVRLWLSLLRSADPAGEHEHPWPSDWDRLEPGVGVMFDPYAGSQWALENEEFKVLDVGDVKCTLAGLRDVVVPTKAG